MLGAKPSNVLSWLEKTCIWHWAATGRPACSGNWQSLCRLARSASQAPSPGTLDFHCGRWIFAEAKPWWVQSTGGGGSRSEILLSVRHESNLGNIYGAEKTGLVYKMPANSKLSVRDEEHIAAHSVCCLAGVVALWGSLGQPAFLTYVLWDREERALLPRGQWARAGGERSRGGQAAALREGPSLQGFKDLFKHLYLRIYVIQLIGFLYLTSYFAPIFYAGF